MSNEVRKAQEEVSVRNAQAVVEYSKETRKLLRDLETTVSQLKNMIVQQNDIIDQQKDMIVNILVKGNYGN